MRSEVVHEERDSTGKVVQLTRGDVMRNFRTPMDYAESIRGLYERDLPPGCKTAWGNVSELYRPCGGQWTLITGIPGHGKSEWLDALAVHLATDWEWRFAVYSPENSPPEVHVQKLLEKHIGKPFGRGPTERMTAAEIAAGLGWLEKHFGFIRPEGDQPASIDTILAECLTWAMLEPGYPTGIIVDPWNELEHMRPAHWSETEYISDTLSKVRRFARSQNCHVWIVAHPAKLFRDKDGKRPVPSPYDVSGSAHWYNKADNCITVWRDTVDGGATQIHVQKVRFKHNGKVGMCELTYDRVTGRYHEPIRLASERYRKAGE